MKKSEPRCIYVGRNLTQAEARKVLATKKVKGDYRGTKYDPKTGYMTLV